jgi:hypothetical protein
MTIFFTKIEKQEGKIGLVWGVGTSGRQKYKEGV